VTLPAQLSLAHLRTSSLTAPDIHVTPLMFPGVEAESFYKRGISFVLSETQTFSSYMISPSDLKLGQLRLLEVDNVLFVPVHFPLSFYITATDVIHS